MSSSLLGIDLPDQRPPRNGDFELQPRAVKRWVELLPLADPLEAARTIHTVLLETNHIAVEHQLRLTLLNALKPGLAQVARQLDSRLNAEPFPLSARAMQMAEMLEKLHREAALAYSCAANALVSNPGGGREALAFALINALRHFAQMLVVAYQERLPPPPSAWQAAHRLFRFSVARRVEGYRPPEARRDIQGSYKQLLLLGTADPRRLRHREISGLFHAFESYSGAVELLPADTVLPPEAIAFVVDLEGEREPVRREIFDGPLHSGCRLLRVDTLAGALLEDRGPQMSAVLRELVEHWRRDPVRGSGRLVQERPFELLVGLTPIHVGLLAEAPPGLAAEFLVQPAWHDEELSGELTPPEPEPQIWHSRDISTDGLRLAWSGEPGRSGIEGGELVALREAGSTTPYHLGIVRWFRGPGPEMEAGVERLGLYPRPVAIKRPERHAQRGLLLGDGINPETLLLAPSLLFASGQRVTLADGSSEREVRLGSVVEEMAGQAIFALADPDARPEPDEQEIFSQI